MWFLAEFLFFWPVTPEILPVVQKGTPADEVLACLKSPEFPLKRRFFSKFLTGFIRCFQWHPTCHLLIPLKKVGFRRSRGPFGQVPGDPVWSKIYFFFKFLMGFIRRFQWHPTCHLLLRFKKSVFGGLGDPSAGSLGTQWGRNRYLSILYEQSLVLRPAFVYIRIHAKQSEKSLGKVHRKHRQPIEQKKWLKYWGRGSWCPSLLLCLLKCIRGFPSPSSLRTQSENYILKR